MSNVRRFLGSIGTYFAGIRGARYESKPVSVIGYTEHSWKLGCRRVAWCSPLVKAECIFMSMVAKVRRVLRAPRRVP